MKTYSPEFLNEKNVVQKYGAEGATTSNKQPVLHTDIDNWKLFETSNSNQQVREITQWP